MAESTPEKPSDCQQFVFSVFPSCKANLPILSVMINNTYLKFLADTGSSINLICHSVVDKLENLNINMCNIPILTAGGDTRILNKSVDLNFKILNEEFSDTFYIIEGHFMKNFSGILGMPFLSKHKAIIFCENNLVNLKNQEILVNKQTVEPLQAALTVQVPDKPEIDVDKIQQDDKSEITQNDNNIYAYVKHKVNIPPLSKQIIELRCRKNLKDMECDFVLEPCRYKLMDKMLVARTVCSDVHGLFVSVINFSEEELTLNKNMTMAKINFCKREIEKINFCGNVGKDSTDVDFDHADLEWEADINLDHLGGLTKTRVKEFLEKNKDIFAASVRDLPGCTTIPHEIHLKEDKPVKSKAYRVPVNLRNELNNQLDALLEADIISPTMSEFASPVILVQKADGQYRLAVDYRKLNKNLIKDNYPLPNITDSIDSLAGSVFFSTLDLTSGFFQQVIRPEDRHKTAIITHRGLHQFNRIPFGLATSSAGFQRLMNFIFGDLANLGILVYVDDIIISSNDIESHLNKLQMVFDRLREHNLRLKPSKCKILTDKIQYLGYEICRNQVAPINKNIEVIKNFKIPTNRKEVRSFLGTLTYNRRFIPDFSKRAIHLTNLTKENGVFKWTPEAQKEFDDLREALISKPCIILPDFTKEFHLYTDASAYALGATLMQYGDDNLLHPVAFASKKLKDAETRYSATERELLALVWATAHFKCYLANTHFTIYTDHAPLTFVLKIRDPTSRIARWICTLSDFDYSIEYIQGKFNGVADFLSRYVQNIDMVNCVQNVNNVNNNSSIILESQSDLVEKIRRGQKSDKKCAEIIDKLDKNVNIAPTYLKFYFHEDLLVCEDVRESILINKSRKLVVPLQIVPEIFTLTHDSLAGCHQGYNKTIERIREHFYWPGMTAHVKNLVDSCISCQQRRAHKSKHLAPLQRMTTPSSPFSVVHCDCVGPMPPTMNGNRFIITYIDAFSKWIEAYPVQSINSEMVADTLADFIARHGCCKTIITDRGKNFLADAMESVYVKLGIKHNKTTPFHPSSNGKLERAHRTLINALSHIVQENQLDWDIKLKFALLAMRTSIHDSTNLTPAAVVYGRNLILPYSIFDAKLPSKYIDAPSFCDLLIPAMQKIYSRVYENLVAVSEKQEKYRNKTAITKDIAVGDSVWLYSPVVKPGRCRKLSKPNVGPYLVVEKLSEVNYKIALETDLTKTQIVHVDRLTKQKSRMEFPPDVSKQTTDAADSSDGSVDSVRNIDSSQIIVAEDTIRLDSNGMRATQAHEENTTDLPIRRSRRFFVPRGNRNENRFDRPSGRTICTRYNWR